MGTQRSMTSRTKPNKHITCYMVRARTGPPMYETHLKAPHPIVFWSQAEPYCSPLAPCGGTIHSAGGYG